MKKRLGCMHTATIFRGAGGGVAMPTDTYGGATMGANQTALDTTMPHLSFVNAMRIQGIAPSDAIRGQRLLKIARMATPVLLSKPCQICKARAVKEVRPSSWHYRPLIDATAVIVACDEHTARVVRGYLADVWWTSAWPKT